MLITRESVLCYENEAGLEINLAPFSTFWAEKCEETSKNNIHTLKQAGKDGTFPTSMTMDERHIVITGFVMNNLPVQTAYASLHKVFNPTLRGVLKYSACLTEKTRKEINCRIEEVPTVYWSQRRLKFDIKLVCCDPFWKGNSVIENIAETLRTFRFPFFIPETGMRFGIKRATLESRFENTGNVKGGFSAVLRARGGTVVNPEIRNEETGERILLNITMRKDDVITILSGLHERRIEVNGISMMQIVDVPNSVFFRLPGGVNRIGYRAEENVGNLAVHVRYVPGYTFA